MQPSEDTHNQPQQQPLRQRSGEKVIQPLNPIIVPPASVAPAQPSVATPAVNPTLGTYSPTSNGDIYQAPSLEYRKPPEDSMPKSVAMQHTSLLVLAILGLVSTVFSIWSLLQLNRAVHHSLVINPNQNTGSAIAILYFFWGAAAFNLAVFTYLLFAKNVHTVTTILNPVGFAIYYRIRRLLRRVTSQRSQRRYRCRPTAIPLYRIPSRENTSSNVVMGYTTVQ